MINGRLEIASMQEHVSAEEWQMRIDLAAAYRLVALHGWDDLIFTHISARVPNEEGHFLINPFGLMFDEITASSLVKVNMNCEKVMPSKFDVNPAGFTIHSAVHAARHDAYCVMHTHTVAGIAVSTQEQGLLPISQQSLFPIASLSYHDYEGVALREEEKARLQADLGTTNNMILRNHGLLTCGGTVADAFLNMFILQRACEVQIAAQAGGNKLIPIPQAIVNGIKEAADKVTKGLGGSLAWPALLRKLDRIDPSYSS